MLVWVVHSIDGCRHQFGINDRRIYDIDVILIVVDFCLFVFGVKL